MTMFTLPYVTLDIQDVILQNHKSVSYMHMDCIDLHKSDPQNLQTKILVQSIKYSAVRCCAVVSILYRKVHILVPVMQYTGYHDASIQELDTEAETQ